MRQDGERHPWQAYRYPVLGFVLVATMLLVTLHGRWGSDFWEHAAVVHELEAHPLEPRHPTMAVDVPHPFVSPYALAVATASRLTGAGPIVALEWFGVLNVLLLVVSLRLFVQGYFREDQEAISSYALLLILFLWTGEAWGWSGFVHFGVLGSILHYPSTFCVAATFLVFHLHDRALKSGSRSIPLLVVLLAAVIVVTHPPTAVATLVGLAALSLAHVGRRGARAGVVGLGTILASLVLVCLWPYFSLPSLVTSGDPEFDRHSILLYHWVHLLWPTAILAPCAFVVLRERLAQNRLDAMALMLAGLTVVYAAGYVTERYGVGRVVSFMAVLTQLMIAVWLARAERSGTWRRVAVPAVLAFLVALGWANLEPWRRAWLGLTGERVDDSEFALVEGVVGRYDLVLADLETSWVLPAFSGKVLASLHVAHWVGDNPARREILREFFSAGTSLERRRAIVEAHDARWILVDRGRVEDPGSYLELGRLVAENERFLLLSVGDR